MTTREYVTRGRKLQAEERQKLWAALLIFGAFVVGHLVSIGAI